MRAVRIMYSTPNDSKNRYQRNTITSPISQNLRADFVVTAISMCFIPVSFAEIHSDFFVSFTLVSVNVFFIKTGKKR